LAFGFFIKKGAKAASPFNAIEFPSALALIFSEKQ
jgi:hypothetical protein